MKIINSITEIIDFYENFIIDQWGVMHNGSIGFKHAVEAIHYLHKKNKNLFIISNSSKRENSSIDKLPNLGFYKELFVKVLTSGEMIWKYLNKEYSKNSIKKKCFHIFDDSKEDGLEFREGLNFDFTVKVDEAEK